VKNYSFYLLGLCVVAGSLAPHKIVFADTVSIWGEYHPPLNGYPTAAAPGFMIEIAQSIFEKSGHKVNYILGPRARGVKMVKEGDIDCVVNAKIKDHHFLAFPTEPWGYHAATLFSLPSSSFKYNDIGQLRDVHLGAIANTRYDNGSMDEYLKQNPNNVSFSHGTDALTRQVKMLLKDRVETIVSCPLLMRGQLKSMALANDSMKIVGEVKPFVGMYLACGEGNKRTEGYIDLLNNAIPEMRANGELQQILDKYGQIDWIDTYRSLASPH